jgi:hypothetical protein
MMAILKSGLVTLGAAKLLPAVLPLGLIVAGTIWVRQARVRRSGSAPESRGSAAPEDDAEVAGPPSNEPDTDAAAPAAGGTVAYASHHDHAGHARSTAGTGASISRGTDREALLSRIIEENVRLREALK